MLDAAELHQRAQAAHRAGRHQAARGLLERARDRSDDADLTGRIELTLAYVEAETGEPARGLERCRAALRLPGITPVTRGLIHSQLALLLLRRGDVPDALAEFDTAVTLLADEPEHLGRALLNRGNLHLQRAEPHDAAEDLAGAVTGFAEAGLDEQAAKARHNLGYARLLAGDLVGALQRMEEAALVLAPLSPVSAAVCEQDRAEVLLAAGRSAEAARALQAAAAAYGARRRRRYQAECELVLARTLLPDDPGRARAVARRAARRFDDHGSPVWARRAEAVEVIADIERGATAARLLDRADDLAQQLRARGHRQDADTLALHAARLAVRRGALADAATRLGRVRSGPDTPVTTRLLAREVRAELAAVRGHRTRARNQVRAGLAELHAWQSTFGSLDLQSGLVGHGQHLARLGLRQALADGSPAVVLEWSERARALASRVPAVRPPQDPDLAADLATLRTLTGSADARRARELRERIRQHSWYAAAGAPDVVGEPTAMTDLVAHLERHGAALVAPIVLDGDLTALVVTPDRQLVLPLGAIDPVRDRLDRIAADLDMVARHPRGDFGAAVRGSLRTDLALVADRLVSPLLPHVGDRRLVLTPSARLAGTPWTLLPGLVGRPLTVPTSASRWCAQVAAPPPRPRRIGLVAGPHVERAAEEVARAAKAWPRTEVVTGAEATAAAVADVAGRVDVLHLAGHGRHPGDNPMFSAVELTDGPWFGHDIDLLRRTPAVVVLSACELGKVSVRHGEESVGMSAAWLHAGARTVLSSPTLVADDVACEALADWHRLVAAGAPPADALATVGGTVGDALPFLCFGAGW